MGWTIFLSVLAALFVARELEKYLAVRVVNRDYCRKKALEHSYRAKIARTETVYGAPGLSVAQRNSPSHHPRTQR